jgi:Family of unknown function (DUF6194)
MNETQITEYITKTFEGVDVVVASGNRFFLYDPDHKFPFATLMTNDDNDSASNLNRPSIFRLNIGIQKKTFDSMTFAADVDFTVLDQLLPHPVYGKMSWVCVLNPSDKTFQTVKQLLAEAYDLSVQKYAKKKARDAV